PLLRLNVAAAGHWLGVKLVGTRSNRDGLGARVIVRRGERKQRFEAQTSGSVLSSSDPRILAGLGSAAQADAVEVRWPSGRKTELEKVRGDRYLTIREP